MNTELASAIEKVTQQQEKIDRYRIAIKELEKDSTNFDAIPSGYTFFIMVVAAIFGYFAYKFLEDSAWWWITLAVLGAVGASVYLSASIVKFDMRYRLGRLIKKQQKALNKIIKTGSEEVAKLGMATIDQIAQKTALGELDPDLLKKLMDIMVQQKLVQKIKLTENRVLYKGLMPQAQMNIISEVIQVD